MSLSLKRRRFWIDAPLQLQLLGYVLILVTASLLLVAFSVLRGLETASQQSRQIFHSLDWVRQTLMGPLLVSSSLSILASGLVTLLWSHRFAGPLRVLAASMARLRHGDLSVPVRIRRTDTHQDLIKEFSQMQEDLRALIDKDRTRAEALGRRLHEAMEKLPAEHPARAELESVSRGLKEVCAEYHL